MERIASPLLQGPAATLPTALLAHRSGVFARRGWCGRRLVGRESPRPGHPGRFRVGLLTFAAADSRWPLYSTLGRISAVGAHVEETIRWCSPSKRDIWGGGGPLLKKGNAGSPAAC